ncbi:Ig-like domain repeat protein [Streptomyces palmae]|uniref:Ig-like domain repeat protein n=1 Tax=Streptomyces palmae TaxID=1701085 RepID=A0A4Z0GJC4_9ACTN|nr:Ig-like domain repeat protein [Streptomyces palmae]TGA95527.1 Ig-like domain repeat protein [Streptomyces palmae]
MRIRTLPAATALAVLFSSAVLTAAPASADTTAPIAVSNADDMVVDGVHHLLYVSDTSQNKIVITDETGKVVATLTDLPQVQDLELSPDSGTLYAAVAGADQIVAFDTATLNQTATYPTGDKTAPSQLVHVGGKLWFGYGTGADSGLGAVDLTAPTPTVTLDLGGDHDWAGPPALYADADNPGTLVALDKSTSAAPIVVYDVSGDTPAIRVSAETGSLVRDAALSPDGQSIVVAARGKQALTEYRLSDLQQARSYPVADEPETVSIAPDGTVAATVLDAVDAGDTYVFSGGSGQPASVRNLSPNRMPVSGHSTSWSADGRKLFLLSGSADATRFHSVDAPRKYLGTLKVDAPSTATRAKSLTVKGSLTSGLALPAGTPLTVTRTDLDSPSGKSLGTKPLGTGGKFSFTDTPPAGGKVTYKVTYAGDAQHLGATASDSVTVSRATPSLSLNNNKKLYSYGKQVTFTAHLGSTYKNRTVEIWADPYGSDKPNKLVKSGKVNSSGNLSASVTLTRDTNLTAVFKGDARYAPRTVKSTVYTKAKVSTSLSKYYKTGKIGSQSYYYFHKTTDVIYGTSMNYYKGRSHVLQIQMYYQGSWYEGTDEYYELGTDGKSLLNLGESGESGLRFRIRSGYVNGTSGDNVNSTAYSGWKYIYFSN